MTDTMHAMVLDAATHALQLTQRPRPVGADLKLSHRADARLSQPSRPNH